MQKSFTCESTGHQGLTFFEAQDSEVRHEPSLGKRAGEECLTGAQNEASIEVNSILPEQLRARVLDFVQFKNTGRMDDLGESPCTALATAY